MLARRFADVSMSVAISIAAMAAYGCGSGAIGDFGGAPADSNETSSSSAGGGAAASTSAGSGGTTGTGGGGGGYVETDPFAGMPTGDAQLQILCARNHGDVVSKAFCSGAPPTITSLHDLHMLLGLDPTDITKSAIAMNSHSSSLVTHFTSPINPRALLFSRPNALGGAANASLVAMGFVRGEQFVELVSKDPTANGALNFFLLRFHQACNNTAQGCTLGDVLTAAVETGFTDYTLYEDEDIKDTYFDCRQCHQPQGPGTQKILRMQERVFPWTHWLFDEPQGNVDICQDFRAAHLGDTTYAGIPIASLVTGNGCRPDHGGPPILEAFVENNGFKNQPNEFLTKVIDQEVVASNPQQPMVNVPPGVSATWQGLYDNYLTGQFIPPPYHDFRITDSAKVTAMTTAYLDVVSGKMAKDQLPDIRDVFLDAAMGDLTFRPHAGQTGREIIVQMCQQCHNSRLDQTVSRAMFNVQTLDTLPMKEKQEAIKRIHEPQGSVWKMPPERFRALDATEIDLVTQELMK